MTDIRTSILLAMQAAECPFYRSASPNRIDPEAMFWISGNRCGADGHSSDSAGSGTMPSTTARGARNEAPSRVMTAAFSAGGSDGGGFRLFEQVMELKRSN